MITQPYFQKVKLINLELGAHFLFNGEEMKLIYNNHSILVGLSKRKFDGLERAVSFPAEEQVLVHVPNLKINFDA